MAFQISPEMIQAAGNAIGSMQQSNNGGGDEASNLYASQSNSYSQYVMNSQKQQELTKRPKRSVSSQQEGQTSQQESQKVNTNVVGDVLDKLNTTK